MRSEAIAQVELICCSIGVVSTRIYGYLVYALSYN